MNYLLVDKYLELLTRISNLNSELEAKVEERTQKLQEAYEQIKQLSLIDPLTRLPNRRSISQYFERERISLERDFWNTEDASTVQSFCFAILDIDAFKKINDTYVHNCGDHILVSVSDLMLRTLRKEDIVGRWGGEEFTVIMPKTDLKGANTAMEKVRKKIASTILSCDSTPLRNTITIGISQYKNIHEDLAQLLEEADQALYKSKKSGKNKVLCFGD